MNKNTKKTWTGFIAALMMVTIGLGTAMFIGIQDSKNSPELAQIETCYVRVANTEAAAEGWNGLGTLTGWENELVPVNSYMETVSDGIDGNIGEEPAGEYAETQENIKPVQAEPEEIIEASNEPEENIYNEGQENTLDTPADLAGSVENIYDYVVNNCVVTEGDPSHQGVQNLINEVYNQQANVLQAFVNNRGKIVVTDSYSINALGNMYGMEDRVYGVHQAQIDLDTRELAETTIYISDENEAAAAALTHELGHYIDYKYGNISETTEWMAAYQYEKHNSGLDEYHTGTACEFFAQIYHEYVHNYENIKLRCPMAVGIVERCVNGL